MVVPPDPMLRLGWPPIIPCNGGEELDRSLTSRRYVNRFTLEKISSSTPLDLDCRPRLVCHGRDDDGQRQRIPRTPRRDQRFQVV
jgi:hypothetical protein